MSRYIDISIPLGPDTLGYPGDPPPRLHWPTANHARGDRWNVGVLEACLHHGTHIDAPWHLIERGKQIDELPVEQFVGPCAVVDLREAARCVDAAMLEAAGVAADCRRLLIRTRNSDTEWWREAFRADYIYLDASAARWCASREMLLVGIDYLSVDAAGSTDFPAHRALLGSGVVILESIHLQGVSAGDYQLMAAPVGVQGADAGWCRAILVG